MGKRIFASIVIMFFCTSLAIAAESNRTRTKDQKKDQECKIIRLDTMQNQIIAKDQIRKRDRMKDPDRNRDGSCGIIGADSAPYQMTAKQNMHRKGNQKGDRQRTQSKTCQG